jgi:hypothetical protein
MAPETLRWNIKRGWLENPPLSMIFPLKAPFIVDFPVAMSD